MIAPQDVTANTMVRALAYSIAALGAAAELDVDRTDDDRTFLGQEKATVQAFFDDLFAADQALTKHLLLKALAHQSRVVIGDAVLDRGVRMGKARMKVELKTTNMPDGADHVFPSDISEIVDAERRLEPSLVDQVVARFGQVPDFPNKTALKNDLSGRATRQAQNFTDRDAGEVTEAKLDGVVAQAIVKGSDALYKLEKRLLERFPREKVYVRAFFLDVAPGKKKRAVPETPPVPPVGGPNP
jgi:hypothetical protein